MKLTKSMVILATLLAVVLLGAVLPAPQQAQAQTPSITMVGLPDLDPMSGRFINVTRGMDSLGDVGVTQQVLNVSLEISPALTQFELWIFDGDMGGLWDRWKESSVGGAGYPFDDVEFVLYRDPQVAGNMDPAEQLASWSGLFMPDNDWFTVTVNQDPGAFNPDRGAYYYHLICNWVITNDWQHEQNNFKVAVQGRPFLRAGSTIGFEGYKQLFDQRLIDNSGQPQTTYDGTFTFYFTLPETAPDGQSLQRIDLWDGDADVRDDTDDLNTPPFPPFQYSPYTQSEGIRPGNPRDDSGVAAIRIPPNVYYVVIGPDSVWEAINPNPSGNQEWELFRIALDNTFTPDVVVPSLPAGVYTWQFRGLDQLNTTFLYVEYDLYPDNPPPPPPPPGTGTPGYWKNHPEAWPVDTITIGGVTYTKEQAIKIMKTNKAKDKTYTMFNALVCAKLNLILGNESSCIALTVLAADNWMKTYGPVGSGVKASSQAWKQGEPLYLELDKYNNGLLCAPHRD